MVVCLRPVAPTMWWSSIWAFRSLQHTMFHGSKLLKHWTLHHKKMHRYQAFPTSLIWVQHLGGRMSNPPMSLSRLTIHDEMICLTKKWFLTFCPFLNLSLVRRLDVAHWLVPIFQPAVNFQLRSEHVSMGFCLPSDKVLWPKAPSLDNESKQSLEKDEKFLPTSKLENASACR
jgi:hypothetical protein